MAARLTYGARPPPDADAYPWVGFDLDHALARYRVPTLMRLVHDCLARALLEEQPALRAGGADVAAALAGCYDPSRVHKGIIVDFRNGDVVKLADDGTVAAASHGGAPLSADALAARYGGGGGTPWWGYDLLRKQARHEAFFVLLTYFDMPCVCLGEALVRLIDEGRLPAGDADAGTAAAAGTPPPLRYAPVRTMLMSAFDYIFDGVKSFDSGRGGFFAALRERTSEFVCRRPGLRRWLLARRAGGRRVFLATNSQQRFADVLLTYSLGPDFARCFDVIAYNCLKPAFFAKVQRPHAVDYATGTEGAPLECVALPPLPPSGALAGVLADDAALAAALPPAVMWVQGHAGAIQALADAEHLLLLLGGDDGGGGSGDRVAHELRVHFDAVGHVTRVCRVVHHGGSGSSHAGDAVPGAAAAAVADAAATAAAAHAVEDLPVPMKPRKDAVSAAHAFWLAHGSSTSGSLAASDKGGAAVVGAAHAPLPYNPHAPSPDDDDEEEQEVPVPRDAAATTASAAAVAADPAAVHQAGRHTPPAAALAQAAADACEAPPTLGLIDALGHRRDPSTGRELEPGGAQGRHPGHARVLYVGDHLHGDVAASVTQCEWDAVAVVEELELPWAPLGAEVTTAAPAEAPSPSASPSGSSGAVKTPLPPRGWHAPPNWEPGHAEACAYGSFFASSAAVTAQSPSSPSELSASRSYFCGLLERHASLAVSDVEAWLGLE